MKLFLLLSLHLTLLLSASAFAQQPKLTRVTVKSNPSRWWTTNFTENHFTTNEGHDSVVYSNTRGDTSTFVWTFRPTEWMLNLVKTKYNLATQDLKHPSVTNGRFVWVDGSREKGSVIKTGYNFAIPFEKVRRRSRGIRRYDSLTYEVRDELDSVFDAEGHLRSVLSVERVTSSDRHEVAWSTYRREITFDGLIPWIKRSTGTAKKAELIRDSTEGEGLLTSTIFELETRRILELPAGYSKEALNSAPPFEFVDSAWYKDTVRYIGVKWDELPSAETAELIEIPFYRQPGRMISRLIRIDSNRFGEPKGIRYDTLEVRFDLQRRLVYQKNFNEKSTYQYGDDGWLKQVVQQSGSEVRIRTLELVRDSRNNIVAQHYKQVSRTGNDADVDEDNLLKLFDYSFPGFDQFTQRFLIDHFSSLSIKDQSISVEVAEQWRNSLSVTLTTLDGIHLTSSDEGKLVKGLLPHGFYQLTYLYEGAPMYVQTVAIHEE